MLTLIIIWIITGICHTSAWQNVFQMQQDQKYRTVECDVIIAGGSTAALGAAIAAARRNFTNTICLTEPTDWLGGQMTSSGVSAIDFGKYNQYPQYQSQSFAEMMSSLGEGNPGRCWVSIKCFLPNDLIKGWINKTISALPNLKVFYNTVIKRVDNSERNILAVTAVKRQVRVGVKPWIYRLSQVMRDWYSESDSQLFTKTVLNFVAKHPRVHPAVIEATEYGDVLALSRASYRIGVEYPLENSSRTLENCGQCSTYPFFVVSVNGMAPKQNIPIPGGDYSLTGYPYGKIWSYRRAKGINIGDFNQLHLGEISQQNWGDGNDQCESFLFLNKSKTTEQLQDWHGGLNLSALASAEDRGWGWYHFYKEHIPEEIQHHLYLGLSDVIGTETGLSKVPYLRDSRRSIGLDGFLLTKQDQKTPARVKDMLRAGINFSIKFHDSIALGNYNSDMHKLKHCKWPSYTDDDQVLPFHIPFRALTNQDYDNLLVAGKSMATTEAGNAAARLHPSEFVTGEASGTASIMMLEEGLTTRQVYDRITGLQQELVKFMPIYWDHPRNTPNLHL